MKRFFAFALTLVMVLGLTACGGSQSNANDTQDNQQQENTDGSNAATTDYPKNTITLYCGYSAGGGSDVICRVLAEKLTKQLGQTVIVENVTGSGGWVLWSQMFADTNPDGYSIYMVNTPNYNLGAYDLANPREYNYDDADLLCNWVSDYNAIGIRKDETRYSDWDSFVAYWKEHPLVVFLATVVYVVVFAFTNYFIATSIMLVAFMLVEKVKVKWVALVTVVYLAFIYYLFVVQLSVRLIR